MTTEEVDQLPKIELTYLYRQLNSKGQIQFIWAEDRGNGDKRHYSPNKKGQNICPNAFIGAVFAIPQSADGSIYGSRGQYIERIEACHEWHFIDQATNEKINALKALKRLKQINLIKTQLDPIRTIYAKMSSLDRALLLAWMTKYIVTGKEE